MVVNDAHIYIYESTASGLGLVIVLVHETNGSINFIVYSITL